VRGAVDDDESGCYHGHMTTTELLEQLKAHALALPKAERARVARELYSAGAELDDVDVDLGVDPSRIERRALAVHDGTAKLVPVDEFFDHVRSRLKAR
jgi:hypothetical protein